MIKRRQHTLEFKQQVVAESSQTGASVAGVALAHGINANQLHKWRRHLLQPTPSHGALIPVTVDAPPIPLSGPTSTSCTGAIDVALPNARLTVRGQVDLDALQTILAALRPR
jgi:transposase